jgi:hypothetical protein
MLCLLSDSLPALPRLKLDRRLLLGDEIEGAAKKSLSDDPINGDNGPTARFV